MEIDALSKLFLFSLIIIALAAAWYLGFRSKVKKIEGRNTESAQDYFIGLNYLLNDEPDGAVDIFINSLELNSNTLETYIALGTLLRRRGKFDRSITIYQDLLAWPQLQNNDLDRVKIELVRSYVSAGLFDRAEGLLEELRLAKTKIRKLALTLGINVYQSEKDWQKAIQENSELIKLCSSNEKQEYQKQASHFYCEIAQHEMDNENHIIAKENLKKAMKMDKNNVRASLLSGKIAVDTKNYKEAIKVLSKVKQQDVDFFSEAFSMLLISYKSSGSTKKMQSFIHDSLEFQYHPRVILEITDYVEQASGREAAVKFLMNQLEQKPSLRMLDKALLLLSKDSKEESSLVLFHQILEEYAKNKALYKCNNCGFELKSLHWLCPSCVTWGRVKPDYSIPWG